VLDVGRSEYIVMAVIPNVDAVMESNIRTCVRLQYFGIKEIKINLLTPNVNYSVRTAPLASKVAFYIFIQQI